MRAKWPYRGYDEYRENGLPMGHEAIGFAETIGADVHHLKVGDVVAMPSAYSRRVFDSVVDLDGVPEGYQAMGERKAVKVMIES